MRLAYGGSQAEFAIVAGIYVAALVVCVLCGWWWMSCGVVVLWLLRCVESVTR